MTTPSGDSFSIGDETYTILPKLTSQNTLKALKRMVKRQRREDALEAMRHLEQVARTMSPETLDATRKELAHSFASTDEVPDEVGWAQIQTSEGIVTLLAVLSPEVAQTGNPLTKAREIAEAWALEHGNCNDLATIMINCSGIMQAKNSPSPDNDDPTSLKNVDETILEMHPSQTGELLS